MDIDVFICFFPLPQCQAQENPPRFLLVDLLFFKCLPRQTPYMAKIAGQVSHLSNFKAL